MQVENISEAIRNLPALGQRRFHIEVVIAVEKIVEDERVDALGLGVETYARIEVGGAALDDHDESVGVGFA